MKNEKLLFLKSALLCNTDIKYFFHYYSLQEREREANELAAANAHKSAPGDECTIRTNPPLEASRGGGGSLSDACETCSHKAGSREALQHTGRTSGTGTGMCNKDGGKFNFIIIYYYEKSIGVCSTQQEKNLEKTCYFMNYFFHHGFSLCVFSDFLIR